MIKRATPNEIATRALAQLITDEPLRVRLREALKCLNPLTRKTPRFKYRRVIIEMIKDASDKNWTLDERAKGVAAVIQTIFRLCE
jgi:hypothetical protein